MLASSKTRTGEATRTGAGPGTVSQDGSLSPQGVMPASNSPVRQDYDHPTAAAAALQLADPSSIFLLERETQAADDRRQSNSPLLALGGPPPTSDGGDRKPVREGRGRLANAGWKLALFVKTKRGWFLTALSFMLFFNIIGWLGCYSLLFVSLQDEFGRNAVETGWVGSLAYIVSFVLSPVADILHRKLSNRCVCVIGVISCSTSLLASSFAPQLFYLYITFGLLYGFGVCIVFKTVIDLLLKYFPDNNCTRVTSLALTGSTMGLFTWTPIATKFLDAVGWRQTMRISAAIISVTCLALTIPMVPPPAPIVKDSADSTPKKPDLVVKKSDYALLKNAKPRISSKSKDEMVWTPGGKEKRMLRMPEAWLFGLACLTSAVSMGFYNVNLVSHVTSLGHTTDQGSVVVTISAAAEVGAKLLFAVFVDRFPCRKVHLVSGLCLAATLVSLSCAFVSSFLLLCVLAVGIGLVKAVINALPITVGMEVFGPTKTSEWSTLMLFPAGLGTILSAFVMGGTYDMFGSYEISIYICTGCFLLTTVAFFLIPLTSRLHKVTGVKVTFDDITGAAEMVPVVEDDVFMVEEIVTTV